MRRVTAKPPNMLTAVSASPTTASKRIKPPGRSAPPPVSGGAIWIIAIGALIQVAPPLTGDAVDRPHLLILGLAVFALALTAVNMFGGFAVTRRMLAMFRK